MGNNIQNNGGRDYSNMMPDYGTYEDKDYRVGFGRRLGAWFIDTIITIIIAMSVAIFYGLPDMFAGMDNPIEVFTNPENMQSFIAQMTPFYIGMFALILIYFIPEIFIGASVGKLALNIRIADKERFTAQVGKLITRYVLKHISNIVSFITYISGIMLLGTLGSLLGFVIFIGCFFVLGQNKQAFHDMIAGTAVYYKDELKDELQKEQNFQG